VIEDDELDIEYEDSEAQLHPKRLIIVMLMCCNRAKSVVTWIVLKAVCFIPVTHFILHLFNAKNSSFFISLI
jgi:hypothetical protein